MEHILRKLKHVRETGIRRQCFMTIVNISFAFSAARGLKEKENGGRNIKFES